MNKAEEIIPGCRLVRSSRKTVAIQVTADGKVIIRAPKRAPLSALKAFAAEKQPWIDAALREAEARRNAKTSLSLGNGGLVLFLGEERRVEHRQGLAAPRWESGKLLLPSGDSEKVHKIAIRFLKEEARKLLTGRVAHFEALTGLSSKGIRIGSAAARWGSCSGDNTLNFPFRLIFAPKEAVDYVVAHELAHTKVHAHTPQFWRTVAQILPDYRDRVALLREFERNYDLSLL